jgi:hypothetical protein
VVCECEVRNLQGFLGLQTGLSVLVRWVGLYCAAGPWGRRFRSSWLSCTGWWFGAFGFVLYYYVGV